MGVPPGSRLVRVLWRALGCALLMAVANPSALAEATQSNDLIAQLQALRAAGDASTDAIQELRRLQTRVDGNAPYPLRRELLRARLAVEDESLSFDQKLSLMRTLRDLAVANGDADTASLMDINRIYLSHTDDDIGKYLDQLNAVRARLSSDASAEVMAALELSYGNMYFDAGNFDTALRHQLAALDWAARLPIGSVRARLFRLATIAELYVAMDLPGPALEYVERAFALPIDDIPVANRISLLGARATALMKKGQLGDAERSLAAADALAATHPSSFAAMRLETLRAGLLLAMSRPREAIATIDRLEALAGRQKYEYYVAKSWELRGDALMQLGQVDAGLALMRKAAGYFESKGHFVDVLGGLDRQIKALRERQLDGQAVTLMEQRNQLWSRLFRNERGRAIAELEARHAAQELERRVDSLSAQNQIQEARLQSERLGKALAIVLALLAVSLSAFLYVSIRRARSERDTLSDVVRFDALTGAFSRYQFQRRRDARSAGTVPDASATGLLLLDLDNFKATNDQFGHEAGDAVLIAVVERIRRVLGERDELYRWGGEEFLVVLHRLEAAALQQDAQRLLAEIESTPVPWHGHAMPVSVSGGYVRHPLAPDWRAPLADAIRWADAALYLAKNAGRRRVEQVELTAVGRAELKGRRPIDMAELQDWQRHGYVRVCTLVADRVAPQHRMASADVAA